MTLLMTTVYFIRHAQPNYENHDDLTRELSAKGREDRKLVTAFFQEKEIHAVLSSPYKRAIDTVRHFADQNGYSIQLVDDFRERKVSDGWIADFQDYSRRQWEDFDYKLPGGESLREVQARNLSALKSVLSQYQGKNVVIGSHGTALSTIVHHYDPSFGYEGFVSIKDLMPWVVELTFDGQQYLNWKQYDLFAQL